MGIGSARLEVSVPVDYSLNSYNIITSHAKGAGVGRAQGRGGGGGGGGGAAHKLCQISSHPFLH